jgi:hypothetical protein
LRSQDMDMYNNCALYNVHDYELERWGI